MGNAGQSSHGESIWLWCADRRTPSMALCAAARVGSRHQRDRRVCPACGGSCGRARRGDIGIKTQDATLAARIDVQTHNVADLDRRLGQIDSAIKEAAKRRKTNAALSAIEGQRRTRAGLVEERKREAGTSVGSPASGARWRGC